MALTKVKLIADGVITSANLDASHGITTSDIGEGSNLYYTDSRVSSYLSTNGFATQTDIVAAITDSAPVTLDTLNELAAALGDDPNFATTTATSLGLKAPLASPSFTGNATFAGNVTTENIFQVYSTGASAVIGAVGNTANDVNIYSTSAGHNGLRMHINGILPTDNSGTIIDNDADLGDPNYRFKNLYMAGAAQIGDNVYMTAGQLYLGASGASTDDSHRVYSLSGAFQIESRESGTWTQRITIDTSGNVGIGETSPSTKVEIKQTNNDIYQLALYNNHISTTSKARIGNWNDEIKISSNYMQSGGTKTQDNTAKSSWVMSMGAAADAFDISRSPAASTTLSSLMRIDSSGNITAAGTLNIGTHGAYAIKLQRSDGSYQPFAATSGNHLYFYNNDAAGNYFFRNAADSSTLLTITNAGKVGIGATNPGYTFTVAKSITNDWVGLINNTYDGAGNGLLIDAGNGTSGEILRLRDRNGNSKVSFLSNGNVGIGYTSPNAKLHIKSISKDRKQMIEGNGNNQGAAMKNTIVNHYPVVSSGNKLIIPFVSQGSLNSTTIVRIFGHSARFNSNDPRAFTADFTVGHLTTLFNLSTLASAGNVSGIAANGMNVEISFTTAYTSTTSDGVYVTIEYMSNTISYSIDVANIAMN